MFGKNGKSPEIKTKKSTRKMPKWLKITIPIVLVAAIAAGSYFIFGKKKAETAIATSTDYTVRRGNIVVTITGSGSIEPNDQYTITPLVKGEILSCSFEEGDMVNKGDVMYVIDSSDQETNVKKAENSLKQAQTSLNEAKEGYDDLTVVSPSGGMVTAVYVEKGDNIGANGKILDIVNNETMMLKVPFNASDAGYISKGASATVNLEGSSYTMNGTVTYIAQGSSVTAEGVEVKYAEIEVKNPGGIQPGDKATAVVGSVACNQPGAFESSKITTVYSKSSGEIVFQPYRVGDKISAGSTVLQLDTKTVDKQVDNAQMSFDNAELSYVNTLDQLDNYKITAPISGTVIQKNSKAGDKLDNGTGAVSMAVIADMSRMTFDISIDELDIQHLQVGQKAQITADAFEDKKFTGTVDYISVIGTTSNGVTTYPVTIVLDEPGGLLPGMNVDATIVVKQSFNTLMIPVEAVQRNNFVYVKDDDNSTEQASEKKDDNSSGQNSAKPAETMDNTKKTYPGAGQSGAGAEGSGYAGQRPMSPGGNYPAAGRPVGDSEETAPAVEKPQNQQQRPSEMTGDETKPGQKSESSNPKNAENSGTTENKASGNQAATIPGNQQTSGNGTNGGTKQSGMAGFGANAPEGYKAVQVTLGINNDSFIEVLSGLKEGDVIYVPAVKRSSAVSGFGMPGGFGGMGGFGGGMPSGGFGGMSGGMGGNTRSTGGMSR